jgi:hypothetical protein
MSLVRNEDAHPPVRMEAISLPSVHPHALRNLPLADVLTTETVPSTTLVNRNTAFMGGADYLRSGRPILHNGLRSLEYEEYFSGFPKLYPLLVTVVYGI